MQVFLFAERLVAWQHEHGRHHLPWQVTDPYCIWLSEIMLQQTQVQTVLDYYPRFLARFPTVFDLAFASEDDVLALWSGLGYYQRARNLHKAAQIVVEKWQGVFPNTRESLETLPGIGRSTAAAIASFAFQARETILDGNVKRVLARYLGVDQPPSDKKVEAMLWRQAEQLLPENAADMPSYTQGLMDLGSLVCTRSRPNCLLCPQASECKALEQGMTNIWPIRPQKKAKPIQQRYFLVIQYQAEVLVEKRPKKGIWGGLYSLPESETFDQVDTIVEPLGDCDVLPAWSDMTHDFTHYRLIMTPIPVKLNHKAIAPLPDNWRWATLEELAQMGLPTPVRRLLEAALT